MKTICRKYCCYFKEEKEDVGYCFPIKLVTKSFFFFPSDTYKFKNSFNELKDLFCKKCDFYKEDCDFHNEESPGLPCGGYIYFEDIISKGLLTIDDIKRLCETFK